MRIKLKRGLDLRLDGAPEQRIENAPEIDEIAIIGCDFRHIRPTIAVSEGEDVRRGQTLFSDRRSREIRFTSPAAGRVHSISRGPRRSLERISIAVSGVEAIAFDGQPDDELTELGQPDIRRTLLASGLWTALRTRPHSRVPRSDTRPSALFVTAIDTNPLAVDPALVIRSFEEDFRSGLLVLSRLVDVEIFVCVAPDSGIPTPEIGALRRTEFDGPHPAGLPGTHIHRLGAVHADAEAWYVGYQDVIAMGKLFSTGEIWGDRVVAIGGPGAQHPRIVLAPLGANLRQLLGDDYRPGNDIISGSVLSGRRIGPLDHFLGRYDLQVTVLDATNSTAGKRGRWPAGMLPLDAFDRVWPHEAPAGALLRAIVAGDARTAESLGCLALDAEDLALCSYLCPSGCDYGSALESTLAVIEKGF